MPTTEKGKELLEKMRAARGFVFPAFALLCERDPELVERYEALKDHLMKREGALPEKYKELFIAVAIAVRNPSAHEGIRNHLRRAMQLGATAEECLESMECTLAPCGMMVLIAGCAALQEALEGGAKPSG